jgi:hypothetical protein
MKDNYHLLIHKLDQFIRKYYKNLILKGFLYSVALLGVFFLTVSLVEYLGHFNVTVRTGLFYGLIASILVILGIYIIIPFSKLLKIGKTISHEQAAAIIGKHFPEVRDKLLNTLQLNRIDDEKNRELIQASIDQKINKLKLVPFQSAINLGENKRYLRYALPPLAIILFILIASPGVIREPAQRIVQHNVYFERELPYKIQILNEKLEAFRNEDFTLLVHVEGEQIPESVFVEVEGRSFKLTRERNDRLSYPFRNVQKNISFVVHADLYRSVPYEIVVIPKPLIDQFEIAVDNPGYTGKKDETLENTGDIVVPEGSRVSWKIFTSDTDSLLFSIADERRTLSQKKGNVFETEQICYKSSYYSVRTVNQYLRNNDSLQYTITVIPDLYPSVIVDEYRDSVFENRLYFRGNIKDDYGFARLSLVCKKVTPSDGEGPLESDEQSVLIDLRQIQQSFYHFFDVAAIGLLPGEEIEYFFEVWDNDGVNGSKSSRTPKMIFRVPSLDEIEQQTETANESIKEDMEGLIKDLQKLQKNADELHKNLIDQKEISWQEKQQMEQLLQQQEDIRNRMEDLKLQNIEKSIKEQQYKELDEEIIQKQKELEKLFDEILSDEMKAMFEEMKKLIDEMDREKLNEMLERMKWTNEDVEAQLDRTLELFKRLEFEKKLGETIDEIDALAEDQLKLAEETDSDKDKDSGDLMQKQEQIENGFEKIREELDELDQMNNELEDPNQMENTDQQEESIQQEMENSKNDLQKDKRSKASQSQKNASSQMKQLSKSLTDMMSSMQMQELGEDIGKLREILENLIQVSFDQEKLMGEVEVTGKNDPKFIGIVQEQKNISDNISMIEDSLFALSKRQLAIQPVVRKEIGEIDDKLQKSLDDLVNKRISNATINQQLVMTSINNLALLLSEALENMMQQMSQMSQGGQGSSCPNPGGSSSSISNMRQLQEQLNKQLEQLKNGMEQGKNNPGMGMQSWSEQLARMAAQQEAIRNQMQQYMEELKEQGIGDDGNMKKMIQDMEQTETDLVNKMITNQTLLRQNEILTRLLESEKAERMREQEEKRESTESKNQKISNPEEIFKYKGIKDSQTEILRSVPPGLKPFYKRKVNEYLYNFEE